MNLIFKNIGLNIITGLLYFLVCSPILWVSYKILYFNESLISIKWIYYSLPTITLFIFFCLLYLGKRIIVSLKSIMLIYFLTIGLNNVDSVLFQFCIPERNMPLVFKIILLIINIGMALLVYKSQSTFLKMNGKIIIVSALLSYLSATIIYPYSVFYIYDLMYYN